jgi:hypothetical protein
MAPAAYLLRERLREEEVLPLNAALRELPGSRRRRSPQAGTRRRARGAAL